MILIVILASQIDKNGMGNRSANSQRFQHRIYIAFGSILGPLLVHFGGLRLQKGAVELEPLMLGTLFAHFWLPRCLGSLTRTHFGTILGAFWIHFWLKIDTETRLYKPTAQQPNNPTAQRPNNPSTQQSNNATIISLNNPAGSACNALA